MIFKIFLSRSVQTPNSDKNWQTSCPLQTFVCSISRHLEFVIEPGQLGLRVAGLPGHWLTKCDPVPCLVHLFITHRPTLTLNFITSICSGLVVQVFSENFATASRRYTGDIHKSPVVGFFMTPMGQWKRLDHVTVECTCLLHIGPL